METTIHYSLRDFELSLPINAIERADEFQKYIKQMKNFGYKSYWAKTYPSVGANMMIDSNMDYLAFVSNDYLGLSQHIDTIEAGIATLRKYGTGVCAAQPIGGYLNLHNKLEKEISEFVGQEDAILFSSGFGANSGILSALLGKNDIAIIDHLD